jgi:hypothetical protein
MTTRKKKMKKNPRHSFQIRTTLNHFEVMTDYLEMGQSYETMVFAGNGTGNPTDYEELDSKTYGTAEAATRGHLKILTKWRAIDAEMS